MHAETIGNLPVVGYAVLDPDGPELLVTFDDIVEAEGYAQANGLRAPIPVVDFEPAVEHVADVIPFPLLDAEDTEGATV